MKPPAPISRDTSSTAGFGALTPRGTFDDEHGRARAGRVAARAGSVYICGTVNYRFAKMFLDRALLPARRDDSIALPLRSAGKSASAHRLAVQDVALSRRKQGFDSPWARQGNQRFSWNRPTPCPVCVRSAFWISANERE
jgi:hypothetical protein